MSKTLIYALKNGKEEIHIGEASNAFRSGMYVWNDMAKRYFGLKSFPLFNPTMQNKIWNAGDHYPLTDSEKIVLASAMDKATVKKENIQKAVDAFKEYGKEHPNSSFLEQADILLAFNDMSDKDSAYDGYVLGWVQTNVCDGLWNKEVDGEVVADLSGTFDIIDNVLNE